MTFAGPSGKVLNKELRANVRMSEAGEVMIMVRGMRGSLDTVFYTVTEAQAMIAALQGALEQPMSDFPIEWGSERDEIEPSLDIVGTLS